MAVAFDSVGPSGGGGAGAASNAAVTWTHTIGSGPALLVVAFQSDNIPTSNPASAKLDPAGANTTIPSVGIIASGSGGTTGFLQVFVLTGVAAGSHTITVTPNASSTDNCGGSVAYTGATGIGTVVTNQAGKTVTVAANTSGNIIFGAMAAGNTITQAGAPATGRILDNLMAGAGSATGNVAAADAPATGSSVTITFGTSSTVWCTLGFEVQGPAGTPAVAGWTEPYAPALAGTFGPSAPFQGPPVIPGPPAAQATAPAGSAPGGSVTRRRSARAVIAAVAAAPILAHAVTGGTVAQRPAQQRHRAVVASVSGRAFFNGQRPGGTGVIQRTPAQRHRAVIASVAGRAFPNGSKPGGVVARRRPARAVTAHFTGPALGVAGSKPGAAVGRRSPARAVTGHVYGSPAPPVSGPAGSKPGGVVARRQPARAVTAHVGAQPRLARALTGGTVTRRRPARAITGHVYGTVAAAAVAPSGSPPGGLVVRRQSAGGLWGGLLSSRTAAAAPGPAGSKPGGIITRRRPARAVAGHVSGQPPAAVVLGPAGSPPGGLVIRRQPPGGLWGGLLSSRVFAGTPPRGAAPGGSIARRKPARAVTSHVYGTLPPPPPRGTVQPRGTVPVPRRYPARGLWQHIAAPARRGTPVTGGVVRRRGPARAVAAWVPVKTTNAPPPPFTIGTLTAQATSATFANQSAASAHTASGAPLAALTARDFRTGGPGG